MHKYLILMAIAWSTAALASPPTFYMGRHHRNLPTMKKAAALALKNPSCKSVAYGVFLPPGQQQYPGKAYMITCNAPDHPGGAMNLFYSSREIRNGQASAYTRPVSIEKARSYCEKAIQYRYGQDTAVDVKKVSDNGTLNRRVDAIVSFSGYSGFAHCIVTPSGQTTTQLSPR